MSYRLRFIPFAVLLTLAGCDVNFRLSSLMTPDRPTRNAMLPQGYVVQGVIIHRGDQPIGVTSAHNPQNSVVILFCGDNDFHRSIEGGDNVMNDTLAVYDYAMALESSARKKRVVYGFSLVGMMAP